MADAATLKKNARKKLLARLGIQSKDLLGAALSASGGGAMKRNEYAMYWEQVDGPTESTWMLREIALMINKQLESWKGSSSASGAGGNDPSNPAGSPGGPAASSGSGGAGGSGGPVALDSLLTTFNFICLTLELLTADVKLKEVLTSWAKIESVQTSSKNLAAQHPLFPQVKELYRLLLLRVDNHELIGPLILNCISMYGSIREFERMMDVVGHSTVDDAVDLKGGESAFYYEHLKRLARDGIAVPYTTSIGKTPLAPGAPPPPSAQTAQPERVLMQILSNTVSKIVTLPQQMKMNPKVAETTFCALFHLLKNLMSLHAITDAGWIRGALSTLQPFYLWPQPYGAQTRDMLTDLQEEALLPGSVMRARVEQEVHTAPYYDSDAVPTLPPPPAAAAPATPGAPGSLPPAPMGELTSALFYIYAQDDKQAQSYVSILDLKPWKQQSLRRAAAFSPGEPALLTPTTQALTLLNMLACEPTTAAGVDADVQALRGCNNEQVYALYKRAQGVIANVAERPAEGKEIRARAMQDLRAQIKAAAAASDKRDLVRLPAQLSAPYTPSLPPVSHLSLPLATATDFHFDPRDQWRMVGHKVAPYAHVALAESLGGLLSMYRDGSRARPLALRLMLAGGDELLHQVVCAWCALQQTKPELFEGLRVLFYVLPFARNHMAAFMARHDAWYNRHVYVPSRSNNFMLPWVRVDQGEIDAAALSGGLGMGMGAGVGSGAASPMSPGAGAAAAAMEEEGGDLPPPGQFFRRTFESYAREASLSMDAQVWSVEGYVSAESEGLRPDPKAKVPPIPGPDQLTPFLQRVELGALAAAAEFKRARKLPDGVRLEDIVSGASPHARGFDYAPVELVVKFTKMDSCGRITEALTEEPAVYQQLLLSAVPRRGDPTFPAAPTAPNLELHAKHHKSHAANKQAALLGRRAALAQDPKQHVVEVEVWAANPNLAFPVLVDGQMFGPYYRLKLLPCFDTHVDASGQQVSTGRRMTFPLQHFFPMDI